MYTSPKAIGRVHQIGQRLKEKKGEEQEGNGPLDLRRLGAIRNNQVMLYNFHCCGIHCYVSKTFVMVASEAMVTSK